MAGVESGQLTVDSKQWNFARRALIKPQDLVNDVTVTAQESGVSTNE